jgi:uncharacterized protein YbjT (DUF2867 family)
MQFTSIVVFGGSGFLGSSLAEQLVRSGCSRILVPTRRADRARHLISLPGLEVVPINIDEDAHLMRCVTGADGVVNLVARLHGTEAEFARAHVDLPRRIAHACARAGVRRLVHVSALGVADDGGPAASRYLRSKTAGELALREASGLSTTVLRPSVMFGERDHLTRFFADLNRMAPILPLAGARSKLQPVWVEDVAQAIMVSLQSTEPANQVYECAGPEVMTLEALVRACGRLAGVERPIIALPNALARIQAFVMEHLPGEPLMSRDNLDSLTVPNIASGKVPGLAALGIHAASFDQIVPAYLQPGRGAERLDTWRALARRD